MGSKSTDYSVSLKSGVELAADVRAGLINPRTEQLNGPVNAIVVKDYERARARAIEADAALAQGELWGPLHGVPMTVKENNDVAGMPTTKGDPDRAASNEPASVAGGCIAPQSEVMIERLLAAGAIIFGKSNLPLNAMDIQSYNKVYGSSSNPWDLTRTPGGSSGGGAAAVALGLTPMELGGDIGGSIRIPAAFCGIYGHKPTFGIIPKRGPTSTKVPTDISVRGPMARSTEDLALLVDVLAGADVANVGLGWKLELPRPSRSSVRGCKVAVWATDPLCPTSVEITAACDAVAEALEAAGATVNKSARPEIDMGENLKVYDMMMASSAAGSGDPGVSYKEHFDRNEQRAGIRRAWDAFFAEWDFLICPSYSMAAFPKDESMPMEERTILLDGAPIAYWKSQFWPILTNTAYLPSTTFPAGFGAASKMPIGLNVVGPEYSDLLTIDFARLLKTECGFDFVAPPMAMGNQPKL